MPTPRGGQSLIARALILLALAVFGAQRDLYEHPLLAAYLRAGRAADARALLARRIDRRPSVPVAGA